MEWCLSRHLQRCGHAFTPGRGKHFAQAHTPSPKGKVWCPIAHSGEFGACPAPLGDLSTQCRPHCTVDFSREGRAPSLARRA